MILSKQAVLFMNVAHIGIKQKMTEDFRAAGFNLTPELFLVMDTLWDEGVMTQQQIADITMRDKNSIVKLINGLEARKLVRRVSNPKDKRQNLIKVTPYSKRIQAEVTDCALRSVESLFKGIPEEDLRTLARTVAAIERNIYPENDLEALARKYPTRKPAG